MIENTNDCQLTDTEEFCKTFDYVGKADFSAGCGNPKRKLD